MLCVHCDASDYSRAALGAHRNSKSGCLGGRESGRPGVRARSQQGERIGARLTRTHSCVSPSTWIYGAIHSLRGTRAAPHVVPAMCACRVWIPFSVMEELRHARVIQTTQPQATQHSIRDHRSHRNSATSVRAASAASATTLLFLTSLSAHGPSTPASSPKPWTAFVQSSPTSRRPPADDIARFRNGADCTLRSHGTVYLNKCTVYQRSAAGGTQSAPRSEQHRARIVKTASALNRQPSRAATHRSGRAAQSAQASETLPPSKPLPL
jgi:hypothetical protein